MKKNTIITAAAIILFLAGLFHLISIFYNLKINIYTGENILWEVPNWVSFIGFIIPLFLSYNLLKIKKTR